MADSSADTRIVEHEASDVEGRTLSFLAAALSVFVIAVAVATRMMFPALADDRDRGPHQATAGIRLQTDARGDLLRDRRRHADDTVAVTAAMHRLAAAR